MTFWTSCARTLSSWARAAGSGFTVDGLGAADVGAVGSDDGGAWAIGAADVRAGLGSATELTDAAVVSPWPFTRITTKTTSVTTSAAISTETATVRPIHWDWDSGATPAEGEPTGRENTGGGAAAAGGVDSGATGAGGTGGGETGGDE